MVNAPSMCGILSSVPARAGAAWLAWLMVCCALLIGGCGEDREVVFSTDAPPVADDRPALLADIAALGNVKDLSDPDKASPYYKAVEALIGRGSRIESTLIETLGGSDDWGVRLGTVEVLKAVGTRRSIEPLMGALEDPHPLVALNADYLLRALTKHSVIPAAGAPAVDGLPPVPVRAETELGLDADEKRWATWYAQYRVKLHENWRTWWNANKATVVVN